MGLLSPVLRSLAGDKLAFKCPGCKEVHQVYIGPKGGLNPDAWHFDGNVDYPTFSPSVDVKAIRQDMTEEEEEAYDEEFSRLHKLHGVKAARMILTDPRWATRCHSFVRLGMIQFLSDCTHEFKNQTLPLDKWHHENQENKKT